MHEATQKMRELLTKFKLNIDGLYNTFDSETLEMMVSGCVMLDGMLKCEMAILGSVYVQSIVRDDLNMVEHNLKTIQATINLKQLHLREFYLN